MHPCSKITVCFLLTLFVSLAAYATSPGPVKSRYKAKVYLHDGTVLKGRLFTAGDSSLTLTNGPGLFDEIRYQEIDKIKVRRAPAKGYALLAGIIITPIVFTAVTAANEPGKNDDGPGAGYRFIGALLLGIFTGILLGTVVDKLISRKKIRVSHEPGGHAALQAQLARYTPR